MIPTGPYAADLQGRKLHGGVSGRYRRYEQTAFIDAFLLDLAGISR